MTCDRALFRVAVVTVSDSRDNGGGYCSYNSTTLDRTRDRDQRDDPEQERPSRLSDDDGVPVADNPWLHNAQQGADTPDQSASSAVGNVADPHLTPIGHRSEEPSSSGFLRRCW